MHHSPSCWHKLSSVCLNRTWWCTTTSYYSKTTLVSSVDVNSTQKVLKEFFTQTRARWPCRDYIPTTQHDLNMLEMEIPFSSTLFSNIVRWRGTNSDLKILLATRECRIRPYLFQKKRKIRQTCWCEHWDLVSGMTRIIRCYPSTARHLEAVVCAAIVRHATTARAAVYNHREVNIGTGTPPHSGLYTLLYRLLPFLFHLFSYIPCCTGDMRSLYPRFPRLLIVQLPFGKHFRSLFFPICLVAVVCLDVFCSCLTHFWTVFLDHHFYYFFPLTSELQWNSLAGRLEVTCIVNRGPSGCGAVGGIEGFFQTAFGKASDLRAVASTYWHVWSLCAHRQLADTANRSESVSAVSAVLGLHRRTSTADDVAWLSSHGC